MHLTPDPTWSFEHHSRFFAGISCSSISDGSIPKSLILAFNSLAVSSQINNAFSASQGFCHHRMRNNLICNYEKSFLRSSLECARMSEGILWLFFQPRSCDSKISLQCKNDIKQSLSRINVNIEEKSQFCPGMFCLFYIKRSTEVHAWLWSDEHSNKTNQ